MSALRYAVDEALSSLWRGRQSGMLSTVTIALALFVLGGFLLRHFESRAAGRRLEQRRRDVGVPQGRRDARPSAARSKTCWCRPAIATGREFVSKDRALTRFKQTFGDLALAVDTARRQSAAGFLRSALAHRLRTIAASVESLAARLRQMPGVADVRYDRQWLDRLLAAIAVIRGVGLVLGSVLTIAAALTVANVVRLALYARRDELEIMQLVGAPQVLHSRALRDGRHPAGRDRCALALVALAGRRSSRCAPVIWSRWPRRSTCPRSAFCRSSCASLLVVGRDGWWAASAGSSPRWNQLRPLQNLDTRFARGTTLRTSTDNSSRGPACHAS